MMKSMQQLRAKVSSGERGFTLVELLIVVAIIGILAAIAIPQFAAYRIRAFNSSASSDARNSRTAEESAFVDFQVYAHTDGANTVLPGAGGFGAGTLFVGPMGPANTATTGAKLTTNAGVPAVAVGVGIGVGNLVGLIAHTDAVGASFIALSKHQNGDTAYGADSDSTALYFVRNPNWIGAAQVLGDANVNGPGAPVAAVAGTDDFNGVGGGGVPIANWSAQ